MLEQILSYISIFILGIFFAHRNSYLILLEKALLDMANTLELNLKNKTMSFEYRFDAYYYLILKHLKEKDYGEVRRTLEKIKHTVKEFLGE